MLLLVHFVLLSEQLTLSKVHLNKYVASCFKPASVLFGDTVCSFTFSISVRLLIGTLNRVSILITHCFWSLVMLNSFVALLLAIRS